MDYLIDRKRMAAVVAFAVVAVITVSVIIAVSVHKEEKSAVELIAADLKSENIRQNTIYFSAEPHPAGSARNLELANEIKLRWESYGFDEVLENDYEVLLSLPTEESYIKYGTNVYQPMNNEGSNVIPPYNAFAKNAKVSGSLVYVNYGRVEDFETLIDLGVNITGAIALCRYGKIFRGSKAQNAHEKGMVGMILYSDPSDSGSGMGKVHPDGQWLPDTGVQRGNVKSIKGDLSTHLYPSYAGGYHASGEELAAIAPKIPVIPIPFNDAKPLHQLIGKGSITTPVTWGEYNLGPSTEKVELKVKTNETLSLCRNVIGVIKGSVEPDRWIVIGVHRDAWIRGASDPGSGMSTVLEISRSLGEQVKAGWRPRRTIMFASWDAEEPGIMGSYEFVEDYMAQLTQKTVAYLNMDTAVSNPHRLNIKSTPNMIQLLYESARKTTSPKSGFDSLYDFANFAEIEHNKMKYSTQFPIQQIGSGSDYTAFLNELGVSCIDFGYKPSYKQTYPVYHTQYDTYDWMNKYGDPDFIYHRQIGEYAVRVMMSLANDRRLPMSIMDYATKVVELTDKLIRINADTFSDLEISTAGLYKLSQEFLQSAEVFHQVLNSTLPVDESLQQTREFNDRLMYIERQFIYNHGLPGRPSFRHLIFAPSSTNTYAGAAFSGIVDAINTKNSSSIKAQIGLVTSKLEAAIRSLDLGIGSL